MERKLDESATCRQWDEGFVDEGGEERGAFRPVGDPISWNDQGEKLAEQRFADRPADLSWLRISSSSETNAERHELCAVSIWAAQLDT